MTSPHPMFMSIFRAYGVAPTGPFTCMYCTQGTDNDDDICDDCRSEGEQCKGCGVTREQHKHMEAPCPFEDCPFKEMK